VNISVHLNASYLSGVVRLPVTERDERVVAVERGGRIIAIERGERGAWAPISNLADEDHDRNHESNGYSRWRVVVAAARYLSTFPPADLMAHDQRCSGYSDLPAEAPGDPHFDRLTCDKLDGLGSSPATNAIQTPYAARDQHTNCCSPCKMQEFGTFLSTDVDSCALFIDKLCRVFSDNSS
jgi:hypothetical protein